MLHTAITTLRLRPVQNRSDADRGDVLLVSFTALNAIQGFSLKSENFCQTRIEDVLVILIQH
jgi:hypothetical protein